MLGQRIKVLASSLKITNICVVVGSRKRVINVYFVTGYSVASPIT